MRHIFIVNPKAGPVNAKDIVLPKLTGQMDKMNLKYEVFVTEYKNHAEEIAKDIVNRGEETQIYVIGGDGTFNEVIRSTRENEKVAVASIPCGSGNDFVRNFTKSNELFFDMKQMAYGNTLTIDLVKVNGSYASSICSVGLDAKVAYGIPKYRRIPFVGGTMAYNMSIIDCLLRPIGHKMDIMFDDVPYSDTLLFACVGNGGFYGGGVNSAPNCDLCDGLLDVTTIQKISRFIMAPIFATYKKGEHILNDEIIDKYKDIMHFCRCKKITVTTDKYFYINIDGECEKTKALCAEVVPHCAKILLPKDIHYKNYV